VEPIELSIPPYKDTTIKITFYATEPEQQYHTQLFFRTNAMSLPPVIDLLGNSIPPLAATLSMPYLAVKPGTLIEVPISLTSLIDNKSSVSQYFSTYSFDITYNPNLLIYENRITSGTASVGCFPDIAQIENGTLRISTTKPFSTFDSSTTLLILLFRTYLGDSPNTELAFNNAKIGINEMCDDYVKLSVLNGRYTIDSICGLDFKLNKLDGSTFQF